MDLLQSRLNRMFTDYDRLRFTPSFWDATESGPRTNLYDCGDHLKLSMEVPGITKDNLSIKIQGNYLEVNGTRKPDAPEGYSAHRVERGMTSFTRSYTLPSDVDSGKVEAKLANGILNLTLPKSEAAKPKQITIS